MEISLAVDIKAAMNRFVKAPDKIKRAAIKGTRAGTRVLFDEDRKIINELIYSKPEDKITRGPRKGKLKWKRTNSLRRGEQMIFPDPLMGIVDQKVGNATRYAAPRHDMDRIGKSGVDRRAPWRKVTVDKVGQQAIAKCEEVFKAEIGL